MPNAEKNGLKWVRRGLIDLSTMSNGCTQAWQRLQASLAELQSVTSADMRLPEVRAYVLSTLETAYAALARIESAFDELGQELEAHHQRLAEMMEEYGVDRSAEEPGRNRPMT